MGVSFTMGVSGVMALSENLWVPFVSICLSTCSLLNDHQLAGGIFRQTPNPAVYGILSGNLTVCY
jgi:hypothetical protein